MKLLCSERRKHKSLKKHVQMTKSSTWTSRSQNPRKDTVLRKQDAKRALKRVERKARKGYCNAVSGEITQKSRPAGRSDNGRRDNSPSESESSPIDGNNKENSVLDRFLPRTRQDSSSAIDWEAERRSCLPVCVSSVGPG